MTAQGLLVSEFFAITRFYSLLRPHGVKPPKTRAAPAKENPLHGLIATISAHQAQISKARQS